MLSRNENQLLLTQFPDPGPNAQGPSAANVLKARALALQGLQHPAEAIDAMDRSLALRRDWSGLLSRARLAQVQGNLADAGKFADEAIQKSDTAEPMIFKVGLLLVTANSSIADFRFFCGIDNCSKEIIDIDFVVESLSSRCAYTSNFCTVCPALEGSCGNLITFFDF
jgi:hypothetical protein